MSAQHTGFLWCLWLPCQRLTHAAKVSILNRFRFGLSCPHSTDLGKQSVCQQQRWRRYFLDDIPFSLVSHLHSWLNVERVARRDVRISLRTVCVKLLRLRLLVKCFYELHLPDGKSCTDSDFCSHFFFLRHKKPFHSGPQQRLSSSMPHIM